MSVITPIPKPINKCRSCGKPITKQERPYPIASTYWSKRKYCTARCAWDAKKVRDQYSSKGERHRRKIGRLKEGTEEWLERIRVTTKNAMYKPEVQEKLRRPRSPLSEEHKMKLSKALAGKMPANMLTHDNTGHYQSGEYETSKGSIYFRSKWEANYALYLDFLIKQRQILDWEYEPGFFVFDKIAHGTTRYLPDFKVINMDGSEEYHEVKGYMDSRSKTKLKRMAKYFPQVKMVLIDRGVYMAIQKQVGKMLHFY